MSATSEVTSVLDASALIALLWDEPGAATVEPLLGQAVISAVNMTEVLQRFQAVGLESSGRIESIEALGVLVEPFGVADAETAADLRGPTRSAGLSLADRACLALARRLGLPAITADTAWSRIDVGVTVTVIR